MCLAPRVSDNRYLLRYAKATCKPNQAGNYPHPQAMQTQLPEIQVQFTLQLPPDIPEEIQAEAERIAKEAYVMTLLRHNIITSGRAGRLLGMHRLDVIELMGKYGISVFAPQTREELEQEVAQTLAILERHQQ